MVIKIVEGIAKVLDTKYPDKKIYVDEIEQESTDSCFLIVNIHSSQEQKLGNRYWREYSFDIHYFPNDEQNPTKENLTVADNLLMALEYITVGGSLVRCSDMEYEQVDGVGHFLVDYNVFVKKEKEPLPFMEKLIQDDELKGG